MCILHAISSMMAQQWFLGNRVQWVGCLKGISWHFRKTVSPQQEKSFSYLLTSQPARPRFMKAKSVKVPALKSLLDRPLDLGNVELMERATNWSSPWGKAFRSLKPHGSSPHRVLDLLCFLDESSDEEMRQMDLDDVTVEHLTASRSALREVISHLELAVKRGEKWWNFRQVAPWLWYWRPNGPWPCLGSEDLSELRAMDARVSMLMTRLKDEAQKVAWTQMKKILTLCWSVALVFFGEFVFCCGHQTTTSQATLKVKHDELHLQVQQLTLECERLKEEESNKRQECENLRKRKRQEKEQPSKRKRLRQAVTIQMQQLQLECQNLRKKQEESECERLKERQAVALQLQELKLESEKLKSEKLKKKEFEFKSLRATAHSLKSKVDKFCSVYEQGDAEDAAQPDSSWELCTLMTEASGISIDTAGRCFMREVVFKASEAFCLGSETGPYRPYERISCSTFEWIRVSNQISWNVLWWNTAGTNSLIELLQLYTVYSMFQAYMYGNCD